MLLWKGGVTVEVTHPSDISRLKSLGYVEEAPVATPDADGVVSEPKGKVKTSPKGKKPVEQPPVEGDGGEA